MTTAGIVNPRNTLLAVIDAAVWAVWSLLVGYGVHRVPTARFERDRWWSRLRRPEVDGRVYERRMRIKRWKDKLPEAGALFDGGFSKRHVTAHDGAYLRRFVAETRRAELCHWLIMALGPFFFLWNPWWLAMCMVAYALAANLPCLLVQRYNRARLLRLVARVPIPAS